MRRALETAHLAGLDPAIDPDLSEWQYGDYEGLTTQQIRAANPTWSIWTQTPPHGEPAEHVAMRADRLIERAASAGGDVAVFGHGHMLRVLAARWLRLAPGDGKFFALSTGSIGILGFEHENRVVKLWNRTPELE
jgi:broad specificity phosphatase PhoE